jgi:hypothetical protein
MAWKCATFSLSLKNILILLFPFSFCFILAMVNSKRKRKIVTRERKIYDFQFISLAHRYLLRVSIALQHVCMAVRSIIFYSEENLLKKNYFQFKNNFHFLSERERESFSLSNTKIVTKIWVENGWMAYTYIYIEKSSRKY